MGAQGSLVGDASGAVWRVPAVPVPVADTTGAGNAYGGGFLVGLGVGAEPAVAAAMAAVSASFTVETVGVPPLAALRPDVAAERLAWARRHTQRL
jgi:ribokinase